MKYLEFSFWTDEANFDVIRNMLKEEFGLVPPIDDLFGRDEKRKLVWEDEQNIGRYRVDFLTDPDVIFFRYWNRITPEIEQRDPMYSPIKRVYDLLKPVKCAISNGGIILEEIVGSP